MPRAGCSDFSWCVPWARVHLEPEIFLCVLVADFLHQIKENVRIVRKFPVFNGSADFAAENPAEIFMPRERQKASGIRQHADKAGEQTDICEDVHLLFHAGNVILKPPCAAELNFAADSGFIALKVSSHRSEHGGVLRI